MNKLTKFSRAILAIAMMLCVALPTLAHDFEVDGIYYNYLDKTAKTVEVTYKGSYENEYYYEYAGVVSIPSLVTYCGTMYSVVSIGEHAFYDCTGLATITIPNSVTSIGNYAFNYCRGLTSVTIGNSVTSIGNNAFYKCTNLTTITIPNSVTTIGDEAFSDCTSLTTITIPNSVTYIGRSAFYNTVWYNNQPDGLIYINNVLYDYKGTMHSYRSIKLEEGTVSISPYAFNLCSKLLSVTIPNSVTSIGSSAFDRCTSLTSIDIPNSVASIGDRTFSGCTGLTSITIPNSITEIGFQVFSDCTSLTSIDIPNSVTSIGYYAFEDCSGLTSIDIPNSVTSIGYSAFSGCTNLTSIDIPNSVTSIDNKAFFNTGWYNNQPDGLIYINNVLYEYKGTMPNNTSINIKEGTVYISSHAFYGCTGLTSITIPNSVTSIGNNAFYKCTNLTTITIPNSVTSIGSGAFYNCTGLTSVTIPNSVTSIGNNAFYGCTGLTSVTIGNSVTSIGDYAFEKCTGLTSVTIPNSVTGIGRGAFRECTGLTSVNIGNSVTSIGDYAFEKSTGLTSVNISDLSAWCKIDFSDFYSNPLRYAKKFKLNGTEIKDLVIPNDISEIKRYAFYNCTCLNSVTIGNSATVIGENAFSSCTGLSTVTISDSVTTIHNNAFYYCNGLTTVTIGNSVTSIGENSFEKCSNLKTIVSFNPTPPTCASRSSFYSYTNATLYVPKDSYAKYFIDDVWGQFTNIKKIEILVSSITLNNSSIELDKSSTATLTATIAPSNATIKNIVWTSSNPQIATVDQSGKVTALSAGTATITAIAIDGSNVSASCKVVVKEVETKITLSQTEANLPVNDIMTLSYEVIPLTTPVEWSTNNENVAYIKKNADNSVMVVGMADGVAIITAKALDGSGVSASCVVTVGVVGVEGVEMDNSAIEVARYDIHGRLLSEPTLGINIVKMSNGTTRKEIVKN